MVADTFYHIYNHANGDENLFRNEENYRFFLKQWNKYTRPLAKTFAYCLMPNHFHALIKTKCEEELIERSSDLTGFRNLSGLDTNERGFSNLSGLDLDVIEKGISQQFSNLFNSYAKAFYKMYERRGSLWNRPFKAKEVTSDSYLTNIICYIHQNPVHHGFTTKIEDWPHSSYLIILSNESTTLQRKAIIDWFGNRKELIKYHQESLKNLQDLEMNYT